MLAEVYSRLVDLPLQIRVSICEECNWSIPTFYRTMRLQDKNTDGVVKCSISNADREAILKVAKSEVQDLVYFLNKFK